jgi:hypothetical protein
MYGTSFSGFKTADFRLCHVVNGKGVAAVRASIEAAFRTLHNDCRDKEQVTADREFHTALQPEEVAPVIETCHIEKSERKAQAYVSAALRSPYVAKQTPSRSNINQNWLVETPAEDAATLIAQALRQLEGK